MEIVGYGVLAVIGLGIVAVCAIFLYCAIAVYCEFIRSFFREIRMIAWKTGHSFHLTKHDYPPIDWEFDIKDNGMFRYARRYLYNVDYDIKALHGNMEYINTHEKCTDWNFVGCPNTPQTTRKGMIRYMEKLAREGNLPDDIPIFKISPVSSDYYIDKMDPWTALK